MRTGLFIRATDIQTLEEVKASQASVIYNQIRLAFAKLTHQKLTFEEYASYRDVPVERVKDVLKIK